MRLFAETLLKEFPCSTKKRKSCVSLVTLRLCQRRIFAKTFRDLETAQNTGMTFALSWSIMCPARANQSSCSFRQPPVEGSVSADLVTPADLEKNLYAQDLIQTFDLRTSGELRLLSNYLL